MVTATTAEARHRPQLRTPTIIRSVAVLNGGTAIVVQQDAKTARRSASFLNFNQAPSLSAQLANHNDFGAAARLQRSFDTASVEAT